MKDIFTVLGKKNGKNAVSLSSLKKDIRELESFLEDHHVECRIKDDEDLIKWSAVRTALEQKDQLDDALYRSLDSMQDYMHTLQYEDINRLLMLDIHQVSDALHHFDSNGTTICLPCFDEAFNRRYLCSPAMFTRSISACFAAISLICAGGCMETRLMRMDSGCASVCMRIAPADGSSCICARPTGCI